MVNLVRYHPSMHAILRVLFGLLLSSSVVAQEPGFIPIFNGKNLDGWDGKPGWWTVEDGAITATSTADHLCRKHNYLMWRGGEPTNFELRFAYRLQNGNSGVQFRSKELPDWDTSGYQADMDTIDEWTGALFEHARGGIAMRNEDVHIAKDGTRTVKDLGDDAERLQSIRHNDWNHYRVTARGSEIQLFINDMLMSRVVDEEAELRPGVIALQMHPGPPMKVQFKDLRLKVYDEGASGESAPVASQPEWIWSSPQAGRNEIRHFRHEFSVAGSVSHAQLFATCDDEMVVWLDGEEIAMGDLWSEPVREELEWAQDGADEREHVLAVRGLNRGPGAAALMLELRLEMADGSTQLVQTDGSWRLSAEEAPGWRTLDFDDSKWLRAQVVGALGDGPWTSITDYSVTGQPALGSAQATPAEQLRIMDGFEVELLYSPSQIQGSWVSMCVDDVGRLIVSDQYNRGLYRLTPPSLTGAPEETLVEKIDVDLSSAQGLLWAFDSLYALVTRNGRYDSGLYRIRDTNGDGQLDHVELLRALGGAGDHGWHGLVASPDGESIYVVAGNAGELPELSSSRVPGIWGEDQLLPRLPDGGGFMTDVFAPGGCIYRVDREGSNWELFSSGYRNPYDAAFHRDGDLFTFDADMEWDMNTPWYRPTRVCLATSGSEYGWRNGSGKWPSYWLDGLPPLINVGPSSPVGVAFGYGADFPQRFQNALYLPDWSYGRIHLAHVKPDGAAYRGDVELFMSGSPLPTTDIIVNPFDGALYFITGGWNIQTGLYRVRYVGGEDTVVEAPRETTEAVSNEARALRLSMEGFHGRLDPGAVDSAWPALGHPDRHVRFAARVALEWQPPRLWTQRALEEEDAQSALTALAALARVSGRDSEHRAPDAPAPDRDLQSRVLEALGKIDWAELDDALRLDLLRVYTLVFTRFGPPAAADRDRLLESFSPRFPGNGRALNAELCSLLVYLQAPGVAAVALELVAKAPTQEEQLEYIKSLRHLEAGWTPPLREAYFKWFPRAAGYRGGASFAGFVQQIKEQAIAALTEEEKAHLQRLLDAEPASPSPQETLQELLGPRTVSREWTLEELVPLVEQAAHEPDLERGRRIFAAVGCFACHRFANEGGAIGPDLTGAGGRFSVRDLLGAIVEPDATVSDLHRQVTLFMSDGEIISGRIVYLRGDSIQIMPDMYNPGATILVDRRDVEEMRDSPFSPMPRGLVDMLEVEEIVDLLEFLRSFGR
ncbi:MAG: heme-binding protein [Planctomycetaceae bacterium]|nr:heme-binding protein [Planctomycetaceae bacterium]